MTTVEQCKAASRFESLRKVLISDRYRRHLDKPLAYWALPTDRRLPLVFLGRPLGNLLGTPFAELTATPGVGHKKIDAFVKLLGRAAHTDPAEFTIESCEVAGNGASTVQESAVDDSTNGFDPANVSEVRWGKWRACVLRHGLGGVTLGRLTPSLRNMTRVNWNTPLEHYTGYSLAELRTMRTHGQKRIRAILEVFHGIYTLVGERNTVDYLVVRIRPRRIDAIEQWIACVVRTPRVPRGPEIFTKFTRPLLEQLRADATPQIVSLAEDRLGISGPIVAVREVARDMGLTRARVYQLLNEINDILLVRWPNGRRWVYDLRDKIEADAAGMSDPPDLDQFRAATELFFPSIRHGGTTLPERMGELPERMGERVEQYSPQPLEF
jgi:hypothetical protein